MSLLQPESSEWGACYLALLGAAQSSELAVAQSLLAAGTPGRVLSTLYPLDSIDLTVQIAVKASGRERSASLDILETLNARRGGLGDKSVDKVYRRVKGEERESTAGWHRLYKAALIEKPLPAPWNGRRSSLYLIWQVVKILGHWPDLAWEERGEFYRICLDLDAALIGEYEVSNLNDSPARWLSGTT